MVGVSVEDVSRLICPPDGHRGLGHHDGSAGDGRSDLTGCGPERTEIRPSVEPRGSADAYEDDVCFSYSVGHVGGEAETSDAELGNQMLLEIRLVEWDRPAAET